MNKNYLILGGFHTFIIVIMMCSTLKRKKKMCIRLKRREKTECRWGWESVTWATVVINIGTRVNRIRHDNVGQN